MRGARTAALPLLLSFLLAAVVLVAVPASAAAAPPERPDGPVVLVGVPGLQWEEIDPRTTPALWNLADGSAIGNTSIRTATSRTCPVDGWLTVSAGQRAYSERARFSVCELPVPPVREGEGAVVADFERYVRENARSDFAARIGLLGQTVREAGGSTLAVGPGAALAAADASGYVDHYVDGVGELTAERLDGAWFAAVDLPDLAELYLDPPARLPPDEEEEEVQAEAVTENARERALESIDAQVEELHALLPRDSAVMIVGVSVDTGASELTSALMYGPGPEGAEMDGGYVASDSTRRAGLVTLPDVSATALHAMALPAPRGMIGQAWHDTGRPADTGEAVERLVNFNTAAVVVGAAIPGFFSGLVALQLLIYAAAAYALHRYGGHQRGKRALVLSVTRVVALGGAAFPVASYLANLIPWWSSPAPQAALLSSVLLADAAVVALAMAGPWRRSILGPMTVVAGITTAVLFIDLCTGANLQMNSPTGYSPIVAGRFYGIGNIAFATFATGMLMAVAGLAHLLVARGRRTAAITSAVVIGAASVLIVGWPGLGTDFGGVIAIVPGLAVTIMMLAGIRLTLPRLALVGVATIAAVTSLAYLDYLRPPNARSHFGQFASQVIDGDAGTVISRKLGAMLGTLGNWQLTLLAACALLFLFAVLNRPTNWRMGALQRVYEYAPTLRAGLTGSLVTALVGFAANDSGIAIPAIALTVAVPLTLSACIWVLEREMPGDGTPQREHEPSAV